MTLLQVVVNSSSTPTPVLAELIKNSSPFSAASCLASSWGTAISATLSTLLAMRTFKTPYSALSLIYLSQLLIDWNECLFVQSYTIRTPIAPL